MRAGYGGVLESFDIGGCCWWRTVSSQLGCVVCDPPTLYQRGRLGVRFGRLAGLAQPLHVQGGAVPYPASAELTPLVCVRAGFGSGGP